MDWRYATLIAVLASVLLIIGARLGEQSAVWPLVVFAVTYGLVYGLIRALSAKI